MPHAGAWGTVLIEGVDVYPVDTLGRLAAPFPDYHSIKLWRRSPPAARTAA